MKYLSIALLVVVSLCTSGQTPIVYSEVVKADSTLTSKILFERARGWFTDAFKDSKNVLEVNDKESGELKGKGTMKVYCKAYGQTMSWGYLHFKINVSVKDGKYKFEIGPYENEYIPMSYQDNTGSVPVLTDAVESPSFRWMMAGQKQRNSVWDQMKAQANENSKQLSESLKKAMTVQAAKSDW
ncbi:MAG: hypothetical protein JWO03_2874 [Bacteroidetes bacterium]|nr:hypothetical protein [Bacteroidota bacterium]